MRTENRQRLLVPISMALIAGCDASAQKSAEGPPDGGKKKAGAVTRVETSVLEPRSFEEKIELSGIVSALNDATLSAQAPGTVTKLLDLGSKVEAGKVIAQLDPGVLRASVAQARATVTAADAGLALAQQNHDRQKPLVEKKVISEMEFESIHAQLLKSQADLAQAKAAYARARKQLTDSTVIAPFTGRIERRFVEVGEQVSPGAPIARVINTEIIKVKAGVPERYAADIAMGASVEMSFSAYGVPPQQGKVAFVGGAIDPKSRTFDVELVVENKDGVLKPEMVAKMLLTRSKFDGVLVVPMTALIHDETGTAVFVVSKKDGMATAHRRRVLVRAESGREVMVLEGLEPQDEIVVLGQSQLTSGDPVEIVRRQDAQAPATDGAVDGRGTEAAESAQ